MYGISNNSGMSNLLNNFYGAKNYGTVRSKSADNSDLIVDKKDDKKSGINADTKEKSNNSANGALKKQVEALGNTLMEKEKTNRNNGNDKNVGNAKDKTTTPPAIIDEAIITPTTTNEKATSQSFTDQLNELVASFMNEMLKKMGIGQLKEGGKGVDFFGNLGQLGGNGASMQSISMQYSLSISAMMTTMNADGSMSQQSMDFSFNMSMDYLGINSGNNANSDWMNSIFGNKDKNANKTDKASANDPLAKLKEMFSPEATAQRILDFALSFYPKSKMFNQAGGDTEDARNSFADYIGKAVQKGFDQALGILGKGLPQSIRDEVDQTNKLVGDGFDNFRKNGLNPANNSNYANLQYFASSYQLNYSSTSIYYSPEETAQLLRSGSNPYSQIANTNNTNADTPNANNLSLTA